MNRHESPSIDQRAPMPARGLARPSRESSRLLSAAYLAVLAMSVSVLGGCSAIKGIFEAGFGVGVVVVTVIVVIGGLITALVMRK
jgi:hypothetical protein